ncbi:pathogenicity island 1 effector protein [Salmonella enterica subsp. enterica]|nr:pathogenicity island 1 effector protein [Salmonella enterica subsp. enterica]SUH87004.1 pathogenicity island 1 effector protein [Salmonella enterica subsp. enterica serovar Typhimurium]
MLISNVGINPAAYLNNHSVENSSQTASQSVSAKDILNSIGISSSKVSDLGLSPTLSAPAPGVLTQTPRNDHVLFKSQYSKYRHESGFECSGK